VFTLFKPNNHRIICKWPVVYSDWPLTAQLNMQDCVKHCWRWCEAVKMAMQHDMSLWQSLALCVGSVWHQTGTVQSRLRWLLMTHMILLYLCNCCVNYWYRFTVVCVTGSKYAWLKETNRVDSWITGIGRCKRNWVLFLHVNVIWILIITCHLYIANNAVYTWYFVFLPCTSVSAAQCV